MLNPLHPTPIPRHQKDSTEKVNQIKQNTHSYEIREPVPSNGVNECIRLVTDGCYKASRSRNTGS